MVGGNWSTAKYVVRAVELLWLRGFFVSVWSFLSGTRSCCGAKLSGDLSLCLVSRPEGLWYRLAMSRASLSNSQKKFEGSKSSRSGRVICQSRLKPADRM